MRGHLAERWQSGRMRLPRKQLSHESGIGGSNPPLSSSHFFKRNAWQAIAELALQRKRTGGEINEKRLKKEYDLHV